MTFQEALDLFKLDRGYSGDELRARWRALAMRHHPDRGGKMEVFQRLALAKRQLDAALLDRRCSVCGGSRKVKVARGSFALDLLCSRCGGTGKDLT